VVVAYLGLCVMGLTLGGLLLRGHARICRFFAAYLSAVLVAEALVTLWPSAFWTWQFWMFKHVVFDVLKIGIALELAYWIFLGFPGAAQSARGVALVLLVGTLAAVLALPAQQGYEVGYLVGEIRARLEVGTAWLFTALAALVRWYRVPLRPMHRALILGFVGYLLLFSTMLKLAADYAPLYSSLAAAQPIAYVAVCCWWAWEAWRPERALLADPAVLARLQPWRVR
jgi:hypothetical protein